MFNGMFASFYLTCSDIVMRNKIHKRVEDYCVYNGIRILEFYDDSSLIHSINISPKWYSTFVFKRDFRIEFNKDRFLPLLNLYNFGRVINGYRTCEMAQLLEEISEESRILKIWLCFKVVIFEGKQVFVAFISVTEDWRSLDDFFTLVKSEREEDDVFGDENPSDFIIVERYVPKVEVRLKKVDYIEQRWKKSVKKEVGYFNGCLSKLAFGSKEYKRLKEGGFYHDCDLCSEVICLIVSLCDFKTMLSLNLVCIGFYKNVRSVLIARCRLSGRNIMVSRMELFPNSVNIFSFALEKFSKLVRKIIIDNREDLVEIYGRALLDRVVMSDLPHGKVFVSKDDLMRDVICECGESVKQYNIDALYIKEFKDAFPCMILVNRRCHYTFGWCVAGFGCNSKFCYQRNFDDRHDFVSGLFRIEYSGDIFYRNSISLIGNIFNIEGIDVNMILVSVVKSNDKHSELNNFETLIQDK